MKHLVLSLLLICVITTSRAQVRRVTFPAASVALYLPPATSSKGCPIWFVAAAIPMGLGTLILIESTYPCTPSFASPCFDLAPMGVAFLAVGVPLALMGLRCVLNKRRANRQVTE